MHHRVQYSTEVLPGSCRKRTAPADVVFVSGGGGATVGDQNNPRSQYGRASFDRPHRFVLSYVYDLPSPHGHGALLNHLFGGWSIAGVTTIQSGSAITLVSTNPNNVFGITTNRAQLASGCTNSQAAASGTVQHKLDHYFNTACVGPNVPFPIIEADGVGTDFGDSGVGLTNGPDQNNWDIAIIKRTRLLSDGSTWSSGRNFSMSLTTPSLAILLPTSVLQTLDRSSPHRWAPGSFSLR